MIRILLADDHRAVRTGVAQFLANYDDLLVVGAAADGAEAVALSGQVTPDVVLMDLAMPVMDGVEATRRILSARPATRVIAFTIHSERERVSAAISAGAAGYLLKGAEPDELVRGIRATMAGNSAFGPEAMRVIGAPGAEPDTH